MNRIDRKLTDLRAKGEKALVLYVAAGDPFPTVEGTASVLLTLARGGADIIELGIPYSDPLADGPVIQAATQRALDAGVNPPFIFDVIRRVRKEVDTPIVLMGYYNTVLKTGLAKFAREMAAAGADGVILSDLPPEEADNWKAEADANGIATIFLLSPTSTTERIGIVAAKMTSGFVYCVSRTGVTGAKSDVPVDLLAVIESIRSATSLPICVGFGVSNAAQVRTIGEMCDGAVIGSKLVDFLNGVSDNADWSNQAVALIKDWKAGTLPA